MQPPPLLRVLLVSAGSALLLGIFVAGGWGFRNYIKQERRTTIRELTHLAPLAATFLENQENLEQQCALTATAMQVRLSILDLNGNILADSGISRSGRIPPTNAPDIQAAIEGNIGTHIQHDARLKQNIVFTTAPIGPNNPTQKLVRLSRNEPSLGKQLDAYLVQVAFPISIILAAAISSLIIFAARIRRNIRALRVELEYRLENNGEAPSTTLDLHEFYLFNEETATLQQRLNEAKEEINRQNIQWRTLFSNMGEAIIVVDDNDSLALVNPAASRAFLLNLDHLRPNVSFHASIRHAQLFELIQQARLQDSPVTQELTVELPAGPTLHFLASALRFSYRHQDTGSTLIVLTDITRIRSLESMREEFVANVSHELKTPLTAIIGCIETVEDCLDEPVHAERFLATASRHGARMSAIIDDLLYLSRLEQGDATVASSSSEGNLRDLAAKCLRQRKQQAADKQIKLITEVPSTKLVADYSLLEQALDNLVTNAIKYCPKNASVTLFSKQSDVETIIGVADTGAGIPEEHLSRIFERFYRVDKSRDRNTGGTGLGLSIVKHVALVHGGSVSVESNLGKGSMFSIHLPRNIDHA